MSNLNNSALLKAKKIQMMNGILSMNMSIKN